MQHIPHQAEVWQETVMIPTYGVGSPDKNPMFLEKRVYQGSSGKVYPLPVTDKILDEKKDMPYRAVFLENDYIRVMVLPELGGRIQRALDKTDQYDFVYYNRVIKPALVGLTGPWISGGIEFNWPQHHRPTTFAPVDWLLKENGDGSKSIEMSEVDQMYGTKGKMTFTVYPDKAYIEIKGQLYNRTSLPQTFLWWANPAVCVNDDTQSVFPPDVNAVYDHGKRDVSSFPIARGVYYKHDYSAGVDISRYRNIPVPTSYMCAHSDYDFVGGYDYGKQAGILHIADHHVSPGKKQWTWGNGDFGRAWDRNLTDEDGPYIELMTGMYCDNQPDFTWLEPFEEKSFTQYFMPYKQCGHVKNASRDIILNLEKTEDGPAKLIVYATGKYENARIVLCGREGELKNYSGLLSPNDVFSCEVQTQSAETELAVFVYDKEGKLLLSYAPQMKTDAPVPDPMTAAEPPSRIATTEELYLTGVHLQQYRHATFLPQDYYEEGLKRDEGDIRLNTAYGCLKLRRGLYAEAQLHFRRAVKRLTGRNPNPQDSTAYLYLGVSLFWQGREGEAYDAFYKAAWSAPQQEGAYYYLACIDARRGEYAKALDHVQRSLIRNSRNLKARALKGLILKRLDLHEQALNWLYENLTVDPFDYTSRILLGNEDEAKTLMGSRVSSYLEVAQDLAEAGEKEKAVHVLALSQSEDARIYYHQAYYLSDLSPEESTKMLQKARQCSLLYCFPNKLSDLDALQYACCAAPGDAKAPYLLGCLWYDKRQYDRAIQCWEKSATLCDTFPTVWRNLSLAYYNKRQDAARALSCMERAYSLDESDARVLLELDQLYRKLKLSPQLRLDFLEKHKDTVWKRDDLLIEYVTCLNSIGKYDEALQILHTRHFHPWEGGEGKATGQYAYALQQKALQALREHRPEAAETLLRSAMVFPQNLGEGKLEGARDEHLRYWLGVSLRMQKRDEEALQQFSLAATGSGEPAGVMYYNDQPADRIFYQGMANLALGRITQGNARFETLTRYAAKHREDQVQIDYFAVSLPDLQLFEEDLSLRNRMLCDYLDALGRCGQGNSRQALSAVNAALQADPSNQSLIALKLLIDSGML